MKRGLLLLLVASCSSPEPQPRAAGGPPSRSLPPAEGGSQTAAADAATPEPSVIASVAAPLASVPAAREPAPLPQGTVVLHVGDSMADALGKDLKRELEARGVKNAVKFKEATYIPQWAGFTMGLEALLYQNNPDLVIITLGGNEVAMPDPSIRAEPVRQIVKMVGDRPCVWIGAPLWAGAPNTGILEVIRNNCAPCVYLDTNALIADLERLGDKVHPTIPERRRWARTMIRWLELNRDPRGPRPWSLYPEILTPPAEPREKP